MPRQAPEQTRKLLAFVAIVLLGVLAVWQTNRKVREREAPLAEGGGPELVSALERITRDPAHLAMTLGRGGTDERMVRHVYARIVGPVDVLALGQSDVDHLSGKFFRDGVHFYNGFLSNATYAYQVEVLDDLLANHHAMPRVVILGVRAPYLLRGVPLGGDDGPPGDLFAAAKPGPAPASRWYEDIDSLLSLDQTELTIRRLATRAGVIPVDDETDERFHVVSRRRPSKAFRFLADGSREYIGERDGVLVPRGQPAEDPKDEVALNEKRLRRFAENLGKLVATGAVVIVYSPPMAPAAYADARIADRRAATLNRVRQICARAGVDYCDESRRADALGCEAKDFWDELHTSRRCNERIVRDLASGCAPRGGPVLREMLAASTLE